MKVVKWYKEALLVRYLGIVNSSLICLSVGMVSCSVFFGGGEHSVYNEANCMLHNRLLSLFNKYF